MTRPDSTMATRTAALIALTAALALSACGVKGNPEPPPSVAGEPGQHTELPPPPPDKPFILDWLL